MLDQVAKVVFLDGLQQLNILLCAKIVQAAIHGDQSFGNCVATLAAATLCRNLKWRLYTLLYFIFYISYFKKNFSGYI